MLTNSTIIGEKNGRALTVSHLKSSPPNLCYVTEKTDELCIIALQYCQRARCDVNTILEMIDPARLTHDFWLSALKAMPTLLQYIQIQTPELCETALKASSSYDIDDVIRCIKEFTPKLDLITVQQRGTELRWIKQQTPEICLAAVQQNGHALTYVQHQTPEICLAAVQQDGQAIKYIDQQTPEICLAAVEQDGRALEYINQQTPEICMAAVKQNGEALKFVKEQTPEICMAAVAFDDEKYLDAALKYVKEQTPDICLSAVQRNGLALKYVQDKTDEICRAAILQNGHAIHDVPQQTPDISMAAVQQNGMALCYVKEQTYDICYAAIQQNPKAYVLVKDPLLKAKLPKKVPKAVTHKKIKISQFKLAVTSQPRIARADLYIKQTLDPFHVINIIHEAWWQNRYQSDNYWTQWVQVMNGQQSKAPIKSYVAHRQAFFTNTDLWKVEEFNIYHYIRLMYAFGQNFFSNELPIDALANLKVAEIDICFFIDFLGEFNPDINDQFIVQTLLFSPDSQASQLLLMMQNLKEFAIRHFETIQVQVPVHIKDTKFRQGLRQLLSAVPHIEPYIQELLAIYKTSKGIQKDLTEWLKNYISHSVNISVCN